MDENHSNLGNEMVFSTFHCSFTKKIVEMGKGVCLPQLESECEIGITERAIVKDEKLALPPLFNDFDKKLTFVIGSGTDQRSLCFEQMIMTMSVDETSLFRVKWKQKPTILSTDASIKSKEFSEQHKNELTSESDHIEEAETEVYIKLFNSTEISPIWQISSDKKYDLSVSHKESGTNLFKDEKVEAAFYQYSVSMQYLISISGYKEENEELKEKCKQLKCLLYFNLAACQLKYGGFENVIANCTKGLEIDNWNVKGLYRRALAYKSVGKIDEARSDLIKIIKRQPKNKLACDLMESLMKTSSAENE